MRLPELYRLMVRARAFETAVEDLWRRGLISGEMHAGTGEEAIAAGVVTHLRDSDGLSLTHRCSPALVVRGVPLVPMLREMLGREDGLCRGRGGHMHLFSKAHLAATTGIVGASVPIGAGFALAVRRLGPQGAMAAAFLGDGAMNQGMALEAFNLAVAWKLPLLVVCADNGWAITTAGSSVTGGDLAARAAAFGLAVRRVDGADVMAVHREAAALVEHVRAGRGPAFLFATCPRLDGHFLGDPLLRVAAAPLREGRGMLGEVMDAVLEGGGAGIGTRVRSVARMGAVLGRAWYGASRDDRRDPVRAAWRAMEGHAAERARIDAEVRAEIEAAVEEALGHGG